MNKNRTARELAQDIAGRSPCGVQVGAVLSDNHGRIISWGWNYYIGNNGAPRITMHAEEHAISKSNPKRLKDKKNRITLTVYGRRNSSGNPVYSKPCKERCLNLARKYGIEILEFSTKQGGWEKLRLEYK